jgi:hypothetical protein
MTTVISNKKASLTVDTDQCVFISSLSHYKCTGVQYFEPSEGAIIRFFDGEREISSGEFKVTGVDRCKDERDELLIINTSYGDISLRFCILSEKSGLTRVIVQAACSAEYPRPLFAICPFLIAIGEPTWRHYYPANPVPGKNGVPLLVPHPLCPLPYVIADEEDSIGWAVFFPDQRGVAEQNRNVELRNIKNIGEMTSHRMILRLSKFFADIFELEIHALDSGWREAFSICRKEFLETMNLCEYGRKDLKWTEDNFLHHFSYVYGKEVFDYASGKVDIERLLDAGKEFGGYDSITLWHQYPRLGIDRRSQWEFFDDFPGGREGLSRVVETVHKRGVKVLLPYKPWDIGASESMDEESAKAAGLIAETDADGFFLDTMTTMPTGFRSALESVKKDIGFVSEGHPFSQAALENLTSSWEQFFDNEIFPVPEVNCLRFAIPGHISPVINRWALAKQKDAMILRAMFSGSGLVIWQDVFGVWLPFMPEQKDLIKKYKKLWLADKELFLGDRSVPLIPTFNKNIICNLFMSSTMQAAIFTIYNYSENDVSGRLLFHHYEDRSLKPIELLWGKDDIHVEGRFLKGVIGAKSLSIIKVSWED